MLTDPYEPQTADDAIAAWVEAQEYSCSCHIHPPCSHCVNGYSLTLEEYLELYGFSEEEANIEAAYDDAMSILDEHHA